MSRRSSYVLVRAREKKNAAVYVSSERAELKGRFVALPRRVASVAASRTSSVEGYKARYEQTNGPTLQETKSLYVR